MLETILVVDEEAASLKTMEQLIRHKLGYATIGVRNKEAARQWMLSGRLLSPDLLLMDVRNSGTQVIRELKANYPSLPVIALVPYGDEVCLEQALDAGASDVIQRPVTVERMRLSIRHQMKIARMVRCIARLERLATHRVRLTDVLGRCPKMKEALAQATRAAAADMPVWVEGTDGTGKEWLARAIHGSSSRAGAPFVVFDATDGAELPPAQLLADRLHEAVNGTLLIRHPGALPAPVQNYLLEWFDAGKPVRIICASCDSAEALVTRKNFNAALLRRLQGLAITLPPLSERRQDISLLARHFVVQYAAAENKNMMGLTEQAIKYLAEQPWPGNLRQLSNLLWRAVMMGNQDMLDVGTLRLVQQWQPVHYEQHQVPLAPALLDREGRIKKLKSIEEEVIRFALQYSGGCMTRTARSLGIGRSTLYRRMQEIA